MKSFKVLLTTLVLNNYWLAAMMSLGYMGLCFLMGYVVSISYAMIAFCCIKVTYGLDDWADRREDSVSWKAQFIEKGKSGGQFIGWEQIFFVLVGFMLTCVYHPKAIWYFGLGAVVAVMYQGSSIQSLRPEKGGNTELNLCTKACKSPKQVRDITVNSFGLKQIPFLKPFLTAFFWVYLLLFVPTQIGLLSVPRVEFLYLWLLLYWGALTSVLLSDFRDVAWDKSSGLWLISTHITLKQFIPFYLGLNACVFVVLIFISHFYKMPYEYYVFGLLAFFYQGSLVLSWGKVRHQFSGLWTVDVPGGLPVFVVGLGTFLLA